MLAASVGPCTSSVTCFATCSVACLAELPPPTTQARCPATDGAVKDTPADQLLKLQSAKAPVLHAGGHHDRAVLHHAAIGHRHSAHDTVETQALHHLPHEQKLSPKIRAW